MLHETLRTLRKKKGYSQEEAAARLNVVRQTVSKWEKGLSVPDAEMLMRIAEELDTSVNVLLDETVVVEENTDIKVLAAKLELLNGQFAKQNESRRKMWRAIFIVLGVISGIVLAWELIEFAFSQSMIGSVDGSVGIIGGADGPTAILVASAVNPISDWLWALICGIVAVVGICSTKRG